MILRERAMVAYLRARGMTATLRSFRTWSRRARRAMTKPNPRDPGFIDGYVAGWKARGRK